MNIFASDLKCALESDCTLCVVIFRLYSIPFDYFDALMLDSNKIGSGRMILSLFDSMNCCFQ